ncbi:glycoside hydrolase family 65 protein [Nakamurella aerolata]|uniref:Glycoside hydrolase family 65 protein n=1 Tax=Nakamurella aerolata TaxID=1656892 RepID=A0A849A578_9ACTN|nr:glycoside hydrolase family 65 protein [Nakamurella aerolata]NNG35675.1 glycoside hydrolase family 65 protein [Nakamurella aerolata]
MRQPDLPANQFAVDPWTVRETHLDFDRLGQSESVFALANGHIGVRGNLDEGDPSALPGTYLNSFYEKRPLPYAEAGYGYPEEGQTVVNVTNGKLIRLLVDDQAFDLRYGTILRHERTLDMRAGVLRREVEWISPSGKHLIVRSTRLVSFTQRAILAVHYEVEPVDSPLRIVLQSELVANEYVPATSNDPRVAAALESPLEPEEHNHDGTRSFLMHRTKASRLRVGVVTDLNIEGPYSTVRTESHPDWTRTTIGTRLQPGETLKVTKFVAYGWSSRRSLPAVRDQVDGALAAVTYTGWDALLDEQRAYLDDFWDGADVEVDGDPVVQQAVRFGLWHVLQAGARTEERAIPAKGLTGPGYDGHAFWDTESYVLPVLTATLPNAARSALAWRQSTIDMAKDRANTLHHAGALFPWRTIHGEECSAYWPAGTAAMHVNADIAVAATRYVMWTGDSEFDEKIALPLLVETARLWMSVGNHGNDSLFHIDGVTGPDEYSALVDDNTFTNTMAARNLRHAADCADRWPEAAKELGVHPGEIAAWRRADDAMAIPVDPATGVVEQDRGYTKHPRWDFEETAATHRYPLLLNYHYFDIYRKQVIKQADLVMAMHWCGDEFTPEQKAAAFDYYEALTVRDSSLSACAQAVLAAEVGHRELAHDYLTETALIDLHDLAHNTSDGVHVASLAGAWLALVCGFGGMRDFGGRLSFAPALPKEITRLAFAIRWQNIKVRAEITDSEATYRIEDGPDAKLTLRHYDKEFTVTSADPVTLPIHPVQPRGPRPQQPAGRPPIEAFREE